MICQAACDHRRPCNSFLTYSFFSCKDRALERDRPYQRKKKLGPNLDPKTGPKQRPKRRNENVIQFWTHFGIHIWTQKWGQPSENFAAVRTCCASRFATLQLEHECLFLFASQVRLLLYSRSRCASTRVSRTAESQ